VSIPGRDDWGSVDGGHIRVSAGGRPEPALNPTGGIPVPRDPVIRDTRGSRDFRDGRGGRDSRDPGSADGSARSLVRPYAVTGGRTKPRTQLQIEAMVTASHYEARDLPTLSPECQVILGFCRDWRSVAEISAVLRMPLGVARVLIADMAVEGLVRIHQTDHAHGRPDLNLLERVLSGLRKL
jgi:hypothetical protein